MELMLSNVFSSELTMSSREIAEVTGKRHPDVNRDIKTMFKDLERDVSRNACIYLDSMNRQQIEYVLDANLTLTLMTGYNTKLRNAIITRWQELEQKSASFQEQFNKICAKENLDAAIGSYHGRGLAERKKTKKNNDCSKQYLLSQMQLTLGLEQRGSNSQIQISR